MSFLYVFPYGVNGFKESREYPYCKCTASVYAKARTMSDDPRFQSVDYMFYCLTKMELEKVNSSINVRTSRIKHADNTRVNNLHLYLKSLRGYASYWHTCRADLLIGNG